MRGIWLVLAGTLMGCSTGCSSSIRAASDYDAGVNFGKYSTFFMLKGSSSGDALLDAQVSSDVTSALMSKGWVKVSPGQGRAAVIFHVATSAEYTYASFFRGWGGWGWRWSGRDNPSTFVEDYRPGTVVVTIFDADTKRAVWRGFAADAISDTSTAPAKLRKAAVAKMFERFPAMTVFKGEPVPATAHRIIFAVAPALLIPINGDPVYRDVPGTALQRVVNAEALILRDKTNVHYLKVFDGWMEAYSLDGWWSVSGVAPGGATVALQQAEASRVDLLDGRNQEDGVSRPRLTDRPVPTVYVSTTPASLILTDGPSRFASLAGTSMEYIENTTASVFREPTDQELYVLVSGQWFRSWKTGGPWQSVPSDELPADFARIPASRLKY